MMLLKRKSWSSRRLRSIEKRTQKMKMVKIGPNLRNLRRLKRRFLKLETSSPL